MRRLNTCWIWLISICIWLGKCVGSVEVIIIGEFNFLVMESPKDATKRGHSVKIALNLDHEIEVEGKHQDEDVPLIRDDEEQEGDEKHDNIHDDWRFKVGRCWLHGQYFITKPCGYIMWHDMLYRSEGCWITMQIWNSLYRGVPAERRPRYTWTDSGCKLWPFINNREEQKRLWRYTRWLIDRFHGGLSHGMNMASRTFCRFWCDVSKMSEDEKPPGVSGRGNSQKQEQIMAVLGRFYWTFNMNADLQWFFIYWLTMDMNELLLQEIKRNQKQCTQPPTYYL